jgi:hypothetical protein
MNAHSPSLIGNRQRRLAKFHGGVLTSHCERLERPKRNPPGCASLRGVVGVVALDFIAEQQESCLFFKQKIMKPMTSH